MAPYHSCCDEALNWMEDINDLADVKCLLIETIVRLKCNTTYFIVPILEDNFVVIQYTYFLKSDEIFFNDPMRRLKNSMKTKLELQY